MTQTLKTIKENTDKFDCVNIKYMKGTSKNTNQKTA